MKYKLNAVRIFVTDFERSLAFYSETLGMPIAFASSESGWAELDTGEAHLALERIAADDAEGATLVGRFVSVSLQVEDLQATYEELVSRDVGFVEPPTEQLGADSLLISEIPTEISSPSWFVIVEILRTLCAAKK